MRNLRNWFLAVAISAITIYLLCLANEVARTLRVLKVVGDENAALVVTQAFGSYTWLEFPDIDRVIDKNRGFGDSRALINRLSPLLSDSNETVRRRAAYAIAEAAQGRKAMRLSEELLARTGSEDQSLAVREEAKLGLEKLAARKELIE
jgi:hypothetical protein